MYGNPNGASTSGTGGAGILQRLTSVITIGRDE